MVLVTKNADGSETRTSVGRVYDSSEYEIVEKEIKKMLLKENQTVEIEEFVDSSRFPPISGLIY